MTGELSPHNVVLRAGQLVLVSYVGGIHLSLHVMDVVVCAWRGWPGLATYT